MKIESLFAIGDIVYLKAQESLFGLECVQLLEVREIHTTSCYAGTQIHYACRAHFGQRLIWLREPASTNTSTRGGGLYDFSEPELSLLDPEKHRDAIAKRDKESEA